MPVRCSWHGPTRILGLLIAAHIQQSRLFCTRSRTKFSSKSSFRENGNPLVTLENTKQVAFVDDLITPVGPVVQVGERMRPSLESRFKVWSEKYIVFFLESNNYLRPLVDFVKLYFNALGDSALYGSATRVWQTQVINIDGHTDDFFSVDCQGH